MKKPFKIFIVTGLCALCFLSVSGQEKVNLAATIGVPDLISIGARFQMKQSQLGLSYGFGTINDSYNTTYVISLDYFNHFSGQSKYTDRRPWYLRGGLNYLVDETSSFKDTYLYTNLRMGRDFNLSKRFGITLDLGLLLELSYNRTEKEPVVLPYWFNFDWGSSTADSKVLPALSFGLFYRL
ncbi:hypothetical protein [[Muricauda] lutisoli]|uniref:DUF3575 domain-containing protein n=1 Tax=[Muricauda] lutisoli TaxID=2816035 RepID=A0ABS3EU91_9FLAO|nr:hypothetical protein [[Muricauda] lutisoli]MBO0329823.1 hypothetical protein [[Muricauda] lutisoli]